MPFWPASTVWHDLSGTCRKCHQRTLEHVLVLQINIIYLFMYTRHHCNLTSTDQQVNFKEKELNHIKFKTTIKMTVYIYIYTTKRQGILLQQSVSQIFNDKTDFHLHYQQLWNTLVFKFDISCNTIFCLP